jgi:hypothetical protein
MFEAQKTISRGTTATHKSSDIRSRQAFRVHCYSNTTSEIAHPIWIHQAMVMGCTSCQWASLSMRWRGTWGGRDRAKGRSLRINHHLSKCTYRYQNPVTDIKHYKAHRNLVIYKLVCRTQSGGSVPKQTILTCHRGTSLMGIVAVNERMHPKWTLASLRPCPGRQQCASRIKSERATFVDNYA